MEVVYEFVHEPEPNDIKKYLANPDDDKFRDLSSYERCELVACAYAYKELKKLMEFITNPVDDKYRYLPRNGYRLLAVSACRYIRTACDISFNDADETTYVALEHEWKLRDIREFLANPDDKKFRTLSDSEYHDLTACAFMYIRTSGGISFDDKIELTSDVIRTGIEIYLNEYVIGYISFYLDQLEIYQKDS